MRYVIAHGDTCLQKYHQVLGNSDDIDEQDLGKLERNKYLVYNHFDEHIRTLTDDSSANMTQSEVIEIEWDQINEIEGTTNPTEGSASLADSQAWDIIDETDAAAALQKEPEVDIKLVKENAQTSTILYDTGLR